jgi:hypothetical protein
MRAVLAAAAGALVLAATATGAAPPSVAPLAAFPGQDSQQSNVNPADVQIAVGPSAVVQAVNTSIAIWTAAGQPLRQQTLGQFFSGGGIDRSRDSTTDPRVLWDPLSGRFFAAMFDISRLELVIAMSITADPLGPWAVFPQPSTGCTDQPRLGVSDNVVVITDDLFSACTGFGRFLGGEVVVLNKQDMLAGVASPRRAHFGPDLRFAALTPASSLVSSPVLYLVAVSDTARSLQLFSIPDSSIASLAFKEVALGGELAQPTEVPQRGSNQPVDAGDNRIQNVVLDGGRLYATATEACGAGRDCGRVFELDPAAARLVRDTTVSLPNGRSLLYPAVAPDSRGNVVLGYSYSSANDFPGFGYTYVRPDGQVATPLDVLPGSAPQTSGRFGDYSGAARDPSDPSRVWLSAQVGMAVAGTSLDWASGIASVRVPPQPPAIVFSAVSAGRVTAALYAEGLPTSYRVEFGPTASYGSQTGSASVPATAREQPVTVALTGLLPGMRYHARVVAANSAGTSTGPDLVLTTPPGPPRLTYPAPAATRAGSVVTLRALVNGGGAPTSVVFQYGTTRAYGGRTTVRRVPGGAQATAVSVRVKLAPGRVYHFRAVATNAKGKHMGSDRTVRL